MARFEYYWAIPTVDGQIQPVVSEDTKHVEVQAVELTHFKPDGTPEWLENCPGGWCLFKRTRFGVPMFLKRLRENYPEADYCGIRAYPADEMGWPLETR